MNTARNTALRLTAVTALFFAVLLAAPAASDAQTTNEKFPFTLTEYVPCANGGEGEMITLSGTIHALIHTSVDANGCTHMVMHFQPQQLTGTGNTTGAKYQGVGVTMYLDMLDCGENGCISERTFVNTYNMIGQGPGNNYIVHQTIKYTYNSCTEESTMEVLNETIKCQ